MRHFVALVDKAKELKADALQTARLAYGNALKAALPSPFAGDTVKLPG